MWKSLKQKARRAEYFFKNKDPVQKVVLDASREDDEAVLDTDKVMIAKLSFNSTCLYSIQKTLWKRFCRIKKSPLSCLKALNILDFCLKYGSPECRDMALRGISELTNVSTFPLKLKSPREKAAVEQSRTLAQAIIDTVQNDSAYDEARRGDRRISARVDGFKVDRSLINYSDIARMQRRKELRASQERLGTDAYTTDEVFSREKTQPEPEQDSSSDSYELDVDPRSLGSCGSPMSSTEQFQLFQGMPPPAPRQTLSTRHKSLSITQPDLFASPPQPAPPTTAFTRQSMPIQTQFVDDLITF